MLMKNMLFFHYYKRKLPYEGLGPVFGMDKTCICMSSVQSGQKHVYSRTHSHQLQHWAQGNSRARGEFLSGPHLKTHIEACMLSQVCSLCSMLRVPSTRLHGLVDSVVPYCLSNM